MFFTRWLTRKAESRLDLTPYQGEWVAIRDNKVVAHAPKLNPLMKELEHIFGRKTWKAVCHYVRTEQEQMAESAHYAMQQRLQESLNRQAEQQAAG